MRYPDEIVRELLARAEASKKSADPPIQREPVLSYGAKTVLESKSGFSPTPDVSLGGESSSVATAAMLPFQVSDASTSDDPSRIQIPAGVLSSSRFGFQDVPTGMVAGEVVYVTVSAAGFAWLKVTVTVTDGVPVSIDSVEYDTGTSIPSSTDTIGYFSLGSYTIDTSGDFNKTICISAGGDVGYLYADGHYFW